MILSSILLYLAQVHLGLDRFRYTPCVGLHRISSSGGKRTGVNRVSMMQLWDTGKTNTRDICVADLPIYYAV